MPVSGLCFFHCCICEGRASVHTRNRRESSSQVFVYKFYGVFHYLKHHFVFRNRHDAQKALGQNPRADWETECPARVVRSGAAPKDTGTLDLALSILDHLAAQASPIALTAIAQTFSASKSTVYRHLSALARHGFVRRDVSTGRYAIGIKLMVLGETSRGNFEIVTVARDALHRLRDKTGQAVSLCTLLDDDLVVLDLMHGRSVVEFSTRPVPGLPCTPARMARSGWRSVQRA